MNLEAEMSVQRKKYGKQFKLDTLQLYENGNKSMAQLERGLGITVDLLSKRRTEFLEAKDEQAAFPGNGNLPESEARLRQLESENAELHQEKETLKNMIRIFSKDAK